MRKSSDRIENRKEFNAFSTTGRTDFELIRYKNKTSMQSASNIFRLCIEWEEYNTVVNSHEFTSFFGILAGFYVFL